MECFCADGTSVPPLIIFQGENLSSTWIPANIHESWTFACNTQGWMSNIHGLEWLRHCFEPATCHKVNGQTRIFICDGHESHVTRKFIQHCHQHNIVILPLHSSHITEPSMSVSVFGPLKKMMAAELQYIIHTTILHI